VQIQIDDSRNLQYVFVSNASKAKNGCIQLRELSKNKK